MDVLKTIRSRRTVRPEPESGDQQSEQVADNRQSEQLAE
jgi:hypothetical protein